MADCLITCITKPHPQSPYEHITHLGNPSAANGGWVWPREKVIASIEDKSNSFYVEDPVTRKRAVVEVRREAAARRSCRPTRTDIGTTTCFR